MGKFEEILLSDLSNKKKMELLDKLQKGEPLNLMTKKDIMNDLNLTEEEKKEMIGRLK